jgi:phosphonate transport system substrate-binding protein
MRLPRSAIVLATAALLLSACDTAPSASADGSAPAASAGVDPDELVVSFVPSSEEAARAEDIEPLAAYLAEQLDMPVTGTVSSNDASLVSGLQAGQVHIGALAPYGMVQAVDRAGAQIVLFSERQGSGTYHTQFFTTDVATYCDGAPAENARTVGDDERMFLNCNGTARANDEMPEGPIGLEALGNLEPGARVSFVDQTSAAGYIFPATVLASNGIDPEVDIAPLFAGTDDGSVIAVCEGQADIGISFDDARSIAASDCDIAGDVVVFAYGPEIPNDGIAVSGDLSPQLRERITAALSAYAATDAGVEVLDAIYQITALTEPNLEALQIVRQAVDELGYEG